MADLHFPRTWKSEGLSVQSMAQHDGSADPVVRELLQNCLDAARKAGRANRESPLRIALTIRKWPVEELPGITAFRRAFKAVRRNLPDGGDTPAAAETVRRIRRALDREQATVLFCTDNGHGLNRDRMRAILAEARGDKGDNSSFAGSFGVGHLTAFAASDLRYVLYGGLSNEGVCVSAHAILASHFDEGAGCHRAGEGFWTDDPELDLHSCGFPNEIPPLLEDEMGEVAGAQESSTGTVVCIAGFNNFREANEKAAANEIVRVAATNFVAAIARGEMELEILGESSNVEENLNRTTLKDRLERHSNQQRSRRGSGGGWLPGAQAFAAWQTLEHGRRLDETEAGVEVRFRPLTDQPAARSRVNVFRNGMWITNNAPELQPSSFAGTKPFDAVVLLEGGGLFDLVRASEGPEHRGVDLKRLSKAKRSALVASLKQFAQRLRDDAGDAAAGNRFRPKGFAVFEGRELRAAERLRPLRHRPGNGEKKARVPSAEPEPGPKPGPGEPNPRSPKPGRALSVRAACRPLPNGDGQVDRVAINLEVRDRRLTEASELGFRLRQDSGSDASCEQPFPPDWLDLRSIEIVDAAPAGEGENAPVGPSNGSVKELSLPVGVSRIIVNLGKPLRDTRGLRVDLVHRKAEAWTDSPETP